MCMDDITVEHWLFILVMDRIKLNSMMVGFDFIECFTTTFLRAHSWLNWVDDDDDEDEVGAV